MPDPLTPDQIRTAIVDRIYCTERATGTIRGLLWALTGSDPGVIDNAVSLLTLADIPFASNETQFMVDPDWQRARGIEVTEDDMDDWRRISGRTDAT